MEINKECFTIFSPDAIQTRKYLKALTWLEGKGFEIKYCFFKQISLEELNQLYPHISSKKSYNLVKNLFLSNSSLIVVFEFTQPHTYSHNDYCEYLVELKGKSDPFLNNSYCLRNFLNAENKILNFLHTSDNFHEMNREKSIFFNIENEYKVYDKINSIKLFDTININEPFISTISLIELFRIKLKIDIVHKYLNKTTLTSLSLKEKYNYLFSCHENDLLNDIDSNISNIDMTTQYWINLSFECQKFHYIYCND